MYYTVFNYKTKYDFHNGKYLFSHILSIYNVYQHIHTVYIYHLESPVKIFFFFLIITATWSVNKI